MIQHMRDDLTSKHIAYENVRVTNTVHIVHTLLYNNIHRHICMECSPDLAARMDL